MTSLVQALVPVRSWCGCRLYLRQHTDRGERGLAGAGGNAAGAKGAECSHNDTAQTAGLPFNEGLWSFTKLRFPV